MTTRKMHTAFCSLLLLGVLWSGEAAIASEYGTDQHSFIDYKRPDEGPAGPPRPPGGDRRPSGFPGISGHRGQPGLPGLAGRCQCVNMKSYISLRLIAVIKVLEPTWSCSKTEIILTLKQGQEVCLNPDSEQGRKLLDCWRSYDKNQQITKWCMRRNMPQS